MLLEKHLVDIFGVAIIALMIVVFVFILVGGCFITCLKNGGSKIVARVFIFNLCLLFGVFIFQYYIRTTICDLTVFYLKENRGQLLIDGREAGYAQAAILAEAFENRTQNKVSGSHPISRHDIKIVTDSTTLHYKLGQDSRDPALYWVTLKGITAGSNFTFISLSTDYFETINSMSE